VGCNLVISGVTVCVTVPSGFTRPQTAEYGLAVEFERCKLLKSGSFPLVRCTHNAGVEGSSPSLSTINFPFTSATYVRGGGV
jgi:hypothetical protein